MAWVAAREAWRQADCAAAYDPARVGIMVGSSRGPLGKRNESIVHPTGKYPPSLAVNSTFAGMTGVLAQTFKVRGPGAAVSATCASAAFAIGLAAEQICLGKADAMIVGGTEAILNLVAIGQLHSLGVVGFHEDARQTCRPFDVTRNGLVLGEGSGFLILESARGAAARGATVLGRLAGWAYRLNDSGRVGVHEDGSNLLHVMEEALQLANLPPAEIGYINAHGTGTQLNDLAEAHSVRNLLGERATTVPCRSTKPITGHCLGATPAIEAILCLQALRQQEIPPVINCDQPDRQCPIHPQSLTGPTLPLNHVLSTSLGFWGYHAALVFSRA
jgi:3-oxoacyl-[acyl-carrier-protein] synthase II